jgi:hypothetical protein
MSDDLGPVGCSGIQNGETVNYACGCWEMSAHGSSAYGLCDAHRSARTAAHARAILRAAKQQPLPDDMVKWQKATRRSGKRVRLG